MSETHTEVIPSVNDRQTSRFGRLFRRIGSMRRRTLWLNIALIVVLILALILALVVLHSSNNQQPVERTATVTRANVTATVTGSGNTESSLSTPVQFQTSGTVTAVNVKPGDTVTLGQVLATVDPASKNEALRSAIASLDNAKAALAQAKSGPTDVKKRQDQLAITTAQQGVANAEVSVTTAQKQLDLDDKSTASAVQNAQDTYDNDKATTDTAIKSAQATVSVDRAEQNSKVADAQSSLDTCRSGGSTTTSSAASAAGMTVSTSSSSTTCTSEQQALKNTQQTRTATINKDQLAVKSAHQSQDTTLDADKAAIVTAQQTRADTLLKDNQSLTTYKQAVTTAEGDLTSAQLSAEADLHPQTPDQIAGYQAKVDGAQVDVDTAQRGLDDTQLKAPQAGVVLDVNGKVGESSGSSDSSSSSSTSTTSTDSSSTSSSSSSAFITIANASKLAVTADIAEADAAKLELGQRVNISFSATNNSTTGSVTQITSQSTVANNVVLYPIKVSLDTAPAGVGVGNTGALTISTGTATNVLTVTSSAITTQGTSHTVTVRRGTTESVVPVTIGLVGDTNTEITSGLSAGDVVVLPNSTSSTNSGAGFPGGGG